MKIVRRERYLLLFSCLCIALMLSGCRGCYYSPQSDELGPPPQSAGVNIRFEISLRVTSERTDNPDRPYTHTIQWEPPYGEEVAVYSITIVPTGATLNDTARYLWQVIEIPSDVNSITYGEVPDGARTGAGGDAKELVPGRYDVYLFAYDVPNPPYDGTHIIGAADGHIQVE